MKVFPSGDGYLVRLERGEEIHESLGAFAEDRGIAGASVTGIGAVMRSVVGWYNLESREYERQDVPENTELLSLTGNLCIFEGRPFLHAHVVLARRDYSLTGGHLFRSEIAVTGEFSILQTGLSMTRRPDDAVGLALLEEHPR